MKINPKGSLPATTSATSPSPSRPTVRSLCDQPVADAAQQDDRQRQQPPRRRLRLEQRSVAGPWSKIADSQKLANSGSALKQSVGGKGYGPGVQAWYNQSLTVDPTNPNHVYVGLEEVYESQNGGSNWNTIAPYWNFYFACWTPDILYPPNGSGACPQTAHTDQHSIAVGGSGRADSSSSATTAASISGR